MRLGILLVIILFLLTACSYTQINEEEKQLLIMEADFDPFINNTITLGGKYKKMQFPKGEIIEYTSGSDSMPRAKVQISCI